MQHKVKVTVIDKKVYPQLQAQYCANPESGACSCYNVGDEFIFERYGNADDFWHMGLNTLKQSVKTVDAIEDIAGGTKFPHCSEAWDAISRYIYTGLQDGAIMQGWMNDERIMIACCSDGTRPVIFKIERMDYKAVYINNIGCDGCRDKIKEALEQIEDVLNVTFRKKDTKNEYIELFINKDISNDLIIHTIESLGKYQATKID